LTPVSKNAARRDIGRMKTIATNKTASLKRRGTFLGIVAGAILNYDA
jgi:hypothetical protein